MFERPAIWSRPFGATQHGWLEEQLGGASEDAQSYWQGRFAACTFCWTRLTCWSPVEQLGRCPKPQQGRCPCTLQGTDEKGRSPPLTLFGLPGLAALPILVGEAAFLFALPMLRDDGVNHQILIPLTVGCMPMSLRAIVRLSGMDNLFPIIHHNPCRP